MKKFTSVILVTCMILSLTACGGAKHTDRLVLALRAGTYSEVIKGCLDAFEAEHGVTCEVLELSEDELHDSILNDSVRGSGEYDLCMVDGSWVSEYIYEGVLADIGELGYSFDDDIIPATTSICVHEGRTYLVPYYGNVTVMMYNKKTAAQLGMDESGFSTLSGVMDFCRRSSEAGHGGFAYRGDTESNIVVDFLPVLCACGGWVVDENNAPTVDTGEFSNAMGYYKKLVATGGALPKEELISAVEDGGMATAVGWPGWYSAETAVDSDYMVFPGKAMDGSPSYNSNIYGIWTLGIPANSTNKELSCALLTYLMDKDVQKETVAKGGVPCRYSCLTDPELLKNDPHLEVICAALENGIYRPVIREWPRFCTILGNEMRRIMADEVEISDGLSLAQEQLEAMMSE